MTPWHLKCYMQRKDRNEGGLVSDQSFNAEKSHDRHRHSKAFSCSLQPDVMQLTDSTVRRQLFLDVLDGTKALVSVPGGRSLSHRPAAAQVVSSGLCCCLAILLSCPVFHL